MTKEEILDILKKKDFIQSEFSVEKIGLFGSYAKNIATQKSDIDFYVEFRNKTFDNIAGLWVYPDSLYDKKIDIVHKHKHNSPTLLKRIKKDIIYG